jgi:hypothetical protein
MRQDDGVLIFISSSQYDFLSRFLFLLVFLLALANSRLAFAPAVEASLSNACMYGVDR